MNSDIKLDQHEEKSSEKSKIPLPSSPSPETTDVPVVVVKEDVWNPLDAYSPNMTYCPHCQNDVVPVVEYKMGFLPPLVACFMLMTCIFCLLSWLPLGNKLLKTVIHFCPVCNREIRRLTRM